MKQLIMLFVVLFTFTVTAKEKSKTVTLNVSGMTCQSCAGTVEKALKEVKGVKTAKVDLKNNQATVTLASTKTNAAMLIKAVSNAGFDAAEGNAAATTTVKKHSESGTENCGDGCCGDECDTDAKPAKAKKTEAKKS